jgi:serine/threonine-protein kinase
LGVVVLGCAAVLAAETRLPASRTGDPAPTSSAPATSVLAIDGPDPKTTNQEALSAYRAALQADHDGNFEAMVRGMREAVRLDPRLAQAYLWLSVAESESNTGTPTDSRAHFQEAVRLRNTVSERDRAWLDALEPLLGRDPINLPETLSRLERLVERYPGDAQIAFQLGVYESMATHHEAAFRAYDRVLGLDPRYAPALRMKAQSQRNLGDMEGARRSLDACLAISPGATSCLNERVWLNISLGRCQQVEQDGRQMIAVDPQGQRGYQALAGAAAALDHPQEMIKELLKQRWMRSLAEERIVSEHLLEANLAVLTGDFVEAEREARRYEATILTHSATDVHAKLAELLVNLSLEQGDLRGAAHSADEFLKRRGAWAESDDPGFIGLPWFLRVAERGGLLSHDQFVAQRDAWLLQMTSGRSADFFRELGYAPAVETPLDAEEALRALAAGGSHRLDSWRAFPEVLGPGIGRTMLLAGRLEEAIPPLESAARACACLESPFLMTRTHLWLGQALEQRGDKVGACAAYAVVLKRWGAAKPRSVSAAKAKERTAQLACAR